MEHIIQRLHSMKPEEFKETEKQICMRCGKVPAEEGHIFCLKCLEERKKIDNLNRNITKIIEKKIEKGEILKKEKNLDLY